MIRFVRSVSFAAAHRYASPGLSEEENKKAYGNLYREEGFGHNFLVEAHFEGDIDPLTGMIINLVDIDQWLKAVASRFDHKHLNEIPEFEGRAPTLERLTQKFFELVKPFVTKHLNDLKASGSTRDVRLVKVRVYEGDDTWVDYGG
jgi:6-pyruvoyltetrahydropterin/6-carboxytetrahydropterin synthase